MKNLLCSFLIFVAANLTAQELADCNSCKTKIITLKQLDKKNIDELKLLVNEIYARNGFAFEKMRFQNYFSEKSWYKPLKNNKDVQLNAVEKQNIEILQEKIKQFEADRKGIIGQITQFKTFGIIGNKAELKKNFGYIPEDDFDFENIQSVLKLIVPDQINWYKNKGLYKVSIDNGFVVEDYGVSIKGNTIEITYNFKAHSEIIEDFDVYTDYNSESEHAYNWQFQYVSGKLKFIKLIVAG